MNIFGVGPLEIIVVLVFALLVLGPEGMVKAGRTVGKFLGQIHSSEYWQALRGSGDLWSMLTEDLGISADLDEMQSEFSASSLPRLEDLDEIKSRTPTIKSQPEPKSSAFQSTDQEHKNKASEESARDESVESGGGGGS